MQRWLFPQLKAWELKEFPIPGISLSDQQPFIDWADTMLTLHRELHEKSESFLANIMVRYGVGNTQLKNDIPNTQLKPSVDERGIMSNTRLQPSAWMKISRKLEKWWELDFAEFVKELKVKIWLEGQEELMSYFEKRASEVREIASRIEATDKEIDDMVFELYGLTEEERRVVLESNRK